MLHEMQIVFYFEMIGTQSEKASQLREERDAKSCVESVTKFEKWRQTRRFTVYF